MKNSFILPTILIALTTTAIFAQESTPAKKGKAKAPEKTIEQLRDPFWPLDWYPKSWGENIEVIEQQKTSGRWKQALGRVVISSIGSTPDGKFFAYVKDRGIVEVGDILQVRYGGAIYKWKIKSISKTGIVPVRLADSTPEKEKK